MLRVDKIDVFYEELQALINVSITLQERDFLSIIGSNGAGKTTLLRTISGLHRPKSGKIFFYEKPIENEPTYRICDLGIIHVPEGRKLFPFMTVYENLEMGAYLSSSKDQLSKRLNEVYNIFPILKQRSKQLAGTLSGGEQQMLAIGRALMAKPQLLMLDEPTLGLSPKISSEIYLILSQLHRLGISILLVSQDVIQALKLAHRAYVIENGRITMEGLSGELLANQKIKEAFLGI